ncbi:MAG: hypothetical protein R3335_12000 [Anaerolineales bacterium]|nr:hypothetical protein [Anaerolineales bacterium]
MYIKTLSHIENKSEAGHHISASVITRFLAVLFVKAALVIIAAHALGAVFPAPQEGTAARLGFPAQSSLPEEAANSGCRQPDFDYGDSAYFAENPEIGIFLRYAQTCSADAETESALLAENPEISAARRLADTQP